MSKIVIICTSYEVVQSTLYLATQSYREHSITIVIYKPSLFEFFQAINERVFHNSINLISLQAYLQTSLERRVKSSKIGRILCFPLDMIREKQSFEKMFDKCFAELKGGEVFFPNRVLPDNVYYLLKKLGRRNRVVYISHARPNSPPWRKHTPTNIIALAWLIRRKLMYGREIAVGNFSFQEGFPYMSDKFMEKYVDRVIDWEEKNEMLKGFDLNQFKVFNVSNYSAMYFDQPLVEIGYATDRNTHRRELTEIFDILRKYFPEKEIARKYHPNFPSDKTMIKIGDVLSDFIPAELLYEENIKIYLGFFSLSLAHVEDGLAVSMIDLISWKNNETRNKVKELLIQRSHSEILFPKSLDEFERILIGIKEKGFVAG